MMKTIRQTYDSQTSLDACDNIINAELEKGWMVLAIHHAEMPSYTRRDVVLDDLPMRQAKKATMLLQKQKEDDTQRRSGAYIPPSDWRDDGGRS